MIKRTFFSPYIFTTYIFLSSTFSTLTGAKASIFSSPILTAAKIDNLLLNQQLTTEAVGVDDVKEALSSVSGEVVQKEVETKAEDELVVVDELEDDVENNPEVKEENEEDKSDEVIEITAEDFKDFFSKNEKMDELIAGYGYETVFEYFDEDKDGKISKEEIKKVSSSADSLEDITFGEMKTFLEKKGKGASEEEKGVTKEELNEIVNSLKEQMMAQMQAQQQAQMGGSSGGGGYSGGKCVFVKNRICARYIREEYYRKNIFHRRGE